MPNTSSRRCVSLLAAFAATLSAHAATAPGLDQSFAAGIGDELHGLFGEIGAVAVSELGTAGLLLLAMAGLLAMRQRQPSVPDRCRARPG